MQKALLIFAALCLTGCASKPPIVTIPPVSCADLIPSDWAKGIDAAPIPPEAIFVPGTPVTEAVAADLIAPWAAAYADTSSGLEKANGRVQDAIGIVRQCEAKVNAARVK